MAPNRQQRQEAHSDPPFYSSKQEIKPPHERCPLGNRRKTVLAPEMNEAERNVCKQASSCSSPQQCPLLAPAPLSRRFFTKCFFVTRVFAIDCSCSGHFSGSSFSCEGSRAPVKTSVKRVCFSPVDGSLVLRRSWRPEEDRECVLLFTTSLRSTDLMPSAHPGPQEHCSLP